MSGTIKTRIEVHHRTPNEALWLHEDILRLEECRKILWKVDPRNISEDQDLAREILQVTTSQIRMCERYAHGKMLRLFTEPAIMKKIERRPQSSVQSIK